MSDYDDHGIDEIPPSSQEGERTPPPSEEAENACLEGNICKSTPGNETKQIVKISPYFPVRNRKSIKKTKTSEPIDSWESGSGAFGSQRKRKKNGTTEIRSHAGCDIYVAAEGESVYAVKSGEIIGCIKSPRSSWGNTQWIAINHGDFTARYCEISELKKTAGKVYQGELIGKVKTTTFAPKQPMLHLEIYNNLDTGDFDVDFNSSAKVNGHHTGRRSDLADPTEFLNTWKNNLPQEEK